MAPAPYTRDALGTIRLNAGRMPPERLAEELGWTLGRLERVARHNGYSLKCQDEHPHVRPPSPNKLRNPQARCVQVSALLYLHDIATLDAIAARLNIKRARVLVRVIENARARGLLFDLARVRSGRPEPASEPTSDPTGAPQLETTA